MQKKRTDLQHIITKYFIIISAMVTVISGIIFSAVQYSVLKEEALENMEHSAAVILESVDSEIAQMSTLSLNAIGSTTLLDTFSEYMDSESLDAYSKNALRVELAGILTSARGFDFSIRQLNAYSIEGFGYGAGTYSGELPLSASDQDWYEGAFAAGGRLYIAGVTCDSYLSDECYFTIVRLFYDDYHRADGFIEVKKYYDTVFDSALYPESSYEPTIVVYDSGGRLLFPKEAALGESEIFDYYPYLESGGSTVRNTLTGKKEHLVFSVSDDYGITVALAVENSSFLAPVWSSITVVLVIYLLIFALCLAFSTVLSRSLSRPLRHIYDFLSKDDGADFNEIAMADTGILEIDTLRDSINEDTRQKKAATESLMLMREQELQSRMLALQAQINPHFLYNSLSTIAEMAEEGQTGNVARMCGDITEILTYISSDKESTVSVEEEMEMCTLYLGCMELRYIDTLTYSFDIPDEMLDFRIPKLCVQILVENAIKSVTTVQPPWHIAVCGTVSENGTWSITIKDDGPGFEEHIMNDLREKISRIKETGVLPSLEIRGMGILNVFIRFYLLWRDSMIFDFGNLESGGAYVRVGRTTDDSLQQ